MIKKIYLDEVDSTNSYILKNFSALKMPVCVMASYQTRGRGQGNNNWISEKNRNLLFSLGFEPAFLRPQESFYISRTASIAIAEFSRSFLPDVTIKWPNDILCNNKKIAGILIENTFFGNTIAKSIVGAGVNLNQTEFPDFHPRPAAGSIKTESGRECSPEDALDFILRRLSHWIEILDRRDFDRIRRSYDPKIFRYSENALYRCGEEIFEAKITDVEEDGHLLLETASGEVRRYAFGEVSFVMS